MIELLKRIYAGCRGNGETTLNPYHYFTEDAKKAIDEIPKAVSEWTLYGYDGNNSILIRTDSDKLAAIEQQHFSSGSADLILEGWCPDLSKNEYTVLDLRVNK